MYCDHPIVEPLRRDDGRLYHIYSLPNAIDKTNNRNLRYEVWVENMDLPYQFILIPIIEYPEEVYVMYSYVLEDGSSYSDEPIPLKTFLAQQDD